MPPKKKKVVEDLDEAALIMRNAFRRWLQEDNWVGVYISVKAGGENVSTPQAIPMPNYRYDFIASRVGSHHPIRRTLKLVDKFRDEMSFDRYLAAMRRRHGYA